MKRILLVGRVDPTAQYNTPHVGATCPLSRRSYSWYYLAVDNRSTARHLYWGDRRSQFGGFRVLRVRKK